MHVVFKNIHLHDMLIHADISSISLTPQHHRIKLGGILRNISWKMLILNLKTWGASHKQGFPG